MTALTAFRGDVIAAGAFTEAGPTQLRGIGRWDGARWSALSEGVSGVPQAMAVYRDALIVAGAVNSAGGVAVRGVARWDGARWSALVASGAMPVVQALCVHDVSLIAAGLFGSIDGIEAQNIARWDGSVWSPLGDGLPGRVLALGVYAGELIAGYHSSFARSGAMLKACLRHDPASPAGGTPARPPALY